MSRRTQLWQIQSGQSPGQITTGPFRHDPFTYINPALSILDSISGYVEQMGSPYTLLPVVPFDPTSPPVPFSYWMPWTTANEHTPQSGYRRKASWIASNIPLDFQLHWHLNFVTATIDTSVLFQTGNSSLDLVPVASQAKRRKTLQLAAGLAQPNVTGIFIGFLNASTYSTISCQLLEEIQRHLLEPVVDAGQTWSLWTQAEVLGFLNLRLQRFALETGLIRKQAQVTSGSGNLTYPDDLLEARRLEFQGATTSSLDRIDPVASDNSYIDWLNTTGTPIAFVEEPKDSRVFQLVPPPSSNGVVDILYVPLPAPVGAACTPLPFPNFFCNFIKWGVISDMLSKEGEANDPARAGAAEQRWLEGIQLAKALLGETK